MGILEAPSARHQQRTLVCAAASEVSWLQRCGHGYKAATSLTCAAVHGLLGRTRPPSFVVAAELCEGARNLASTCQLKQQVLRSSKVLIHFAWALDCW